MDASRRSDASYAPRAVRAGVWLSAVGPVAVALLGAFVIHRLVMLVRTHPDPRFSYDYAAGLAMPIPYVRYVDNGWPVFWAILVTLAFTWWLSMRASAVLAERGAPPIALGVFTAAIYAALACCAITISGDIYAYMLWGRLYGVFGINPYVLNAPLRGSDAVIGKLLTIYANPPPADDYGPLWTLMAGAIAKIENSASIVTQFLTHRIVSIASVLAAVAALWRLSAAAPARERFARVALFAFNPLMLYEGAVEVHYDMLMVAFALWAYALAPDLPLVAGLLIGAAIGVKFVAVILVPFIAVRAARRHGFSPALLGLGACALAVVLFFRPFWSGPATLLSLWRQGSSIGGSAMWLARVALHSAFGIDPNAVLLAIAPLIFAGFFIWAFVRYARSPSSREIWRTVAALIWTAPGLNAEYLLWLAPAMAGADRTWSRYAWWLAITGLGFYALYIDRPAASDIVVRYEILALVLAMIVIPVAATLWARRRRDAAAESAG